MEAANNAVYKDKDAEASPLPVRVIIEANPHPNQLARLTFEYLFINRLQGFVMTQRVVLEHHIQHLNLLAVKRQTRSIKAWHAIEAQETRNKEEIWQRLQQLHFNDGNPEHLLPKVSGLLWLKLRCDHDTPLAIARYGAYRNNEYPTTQWSTCGMQFALQDCHLCWAIACSEREIIGETAGSFPVNDNPPGHMYVRGEATRFLQTHIDLIEDWELHKASILELLLNKNVRVSTHWHPLLNLLFDPLIGVLDIY